MVFYGKEHSDNSHRYEDRADYAIYEPQWSDIKAGTQFAHEKSYEIPPYQRSAEYRQIGPYIMEYFKFREYEIESCEQTNDKKQYKRVGDSQEKTRYKVTPIAAAVDLSSFQRTCRIFSEQIETECSQNYASEDLQCKLVTLDDVRNETKSETCEQAIEQVAQGSSDSGKKRRPSPFAKSSLDNQHADWTHRGRDQSTDSQSAGQYVD